MHQAGDEGKQELSMVHSLMTVALALARQAIDNQEVPVGAVFARVRPDQSYDILASSHNLTNQTHDASRHCEMICLAALQEQGIPTSELCLAVTVEPCIMCAYALNLAGIKKVYYGASNSKFGGNGTVLPVNTFGPNGYEAQGGFHESEAVKLLQGFYQSGNQSIPDTFRQRKRVKS